MDFLYEKIAYLRGLADGLEVKDDTREGKLFNAFMDVIEEIADSMSDIIEDQDEVDEYLDLLDEDLSIVEEEVFGDLEYFDDDDYEYDEDDDDYDFDFDGDDELADEFHKEEHPCDCAPLED
jgi:DNA-directed RNA polymerase subunit delta